MMELLMNALAVLGLLVLGIFALVGFGARYAAGTYDRQTAAYFRRRYPEYYGNPVPDPDELANRVSEYYHCGVDLAPDTPSLSRYVICQPGGRLVDVFIRDHREEWRQKRRLYFYEQQLNPWAGIGQYQLEA